MQNNNLNKIRELNALADSLQYENRVENKDIIRRLKTFYEELLSVMPPFDACYESVLRLSNSLNSSEYHAVYNRTSEKTIQYILNYATKSKIYLPYPRPISAIAVQRLHELFVKNNPEAIQLVQDYQQMAAQSKDEDAIRLLGRLADKTRPEINKDVAEDVAELLYNCLKVKGIPYIKTEDNSALKSSRATNNYISANEMIRPYSPIEPLPVFSGDNVYLALIRIFNHLGGVQNQSDFTSVVEALSLKGDNAKKSIYSRGECS